MLAAPARSFNAGTAISEAITPRQKKRTLVHYNVMLFVIERRYAHLSSKAKSVYQALVSYDLPDRRTGECKGYVFVSPETIAGQFDLGRRQAERYVKELKDATLIYAQRRSNTSSIYYLLDIPLSDADYAAYQQWKQDERAKKREMSLAYKRMNEDKKIKNKQIQSSEENQISGVVKDLVRLGFDKKQARYYVRLKGEAYCGEKILALCFELQRGGQIRDYARWLHAAILRDFHVARPVYISGRARRRSSVQHSQKVPALPIEATHELVTDDDGYTYYREKKSIYLVDSKDTLSDSITSYRTTVPNEPCVSINFNPYNINEYPAYVPHSRPICASLPLPERGSGYYHLEHADLPQQNAPAHVAVPNVVATRPPLDEQMPSVKTKRWKGGLVDRSRRRLCGVQRTVMHEKACEKRRCTSRTGREMRRGAQYRVVHTAYWQKRAEKVQRSEIAIALSYFKGTVYRMDLRRIQPLRDRTKRRGRRERKVRIDKDEIPFTDRDLAVLSWIGEMYLARFDQVKVLLERNSDVAKGDAPRSLTSDAVRKVILRWLRRGVVGYKKILASQSGYVWLSSRGLREMGFKETELSYRDWEPRPTTIEHNYWVNQVRLWYEKEPRDAFQWVSERTIKARKGNRKGHDADAEIHADSKTYALEVELSTKSPEDTKAIMRSLLRERVEQNVYKYALALYVTNTKTAPLIMRTKEQFPLAEQQRIRVQSIFDYL